MHRPSLRSGLPFALLLAACGAPPGEGEDAGGSVCSADTDCADGVFCDGVERCLPTDPGADARGCVAGPSPCADGLRCDEEGGRCLAPGACEVPDADGDGEDALECGGADCDDGDPLRYPGAVEVCDPVGRDEDCDPSTLGPDRDGDGAVSTACCNVQTDGTFLCGTDCDDASGSVGPSGVEVCNGIDEDCDGAVDEGVRMTLYRDFDGDGFGDAATAAERACGDPLYVADGSDCDDTDAEVRPGATEICDGRDNDCDGDAAAEIDADGDGHLAPVSTCIGGPRPKDDCRDDDLTVHGGRAELCNDRDDDCDGQVDERASTDAVCSADAERATAICAYSGNVALGNACLITSCAVGYADCDGAIGNGCEVDLMSDSVHCGGCGFPCRTGGCANGLCAAEGSPPAEVVLRAEATVVRTIEGGVAIDESGGLARRLIGLNETDGTAVRGAVDVDLGLGVCFAREDGRVSCQGGGAPGRTGPTDSALADVAGIAGATAVSVGWFHLCARTPTAVRCFGDDARGQLGNGGDVGPGPVDAVSPAGGALIASHLASWEYTSCATETGTGAVLCWGGATAYLEATGVSGDLDAPTAVLGVGDEPLTGDRVFVSRAHACALAGTEAYCWGSNQYGEADPTAVGADVARATRLRDSDGTPLEVLDLALGAEGNTCVQLVGGAWHCMGRNAAGEAGTGEVGTQTGIGDAVGHHDYASFAVGGVAVGEYRACGLFGDWLHCWGSNANGGLLAPPAVDGSALGIAARMYGRTTSVALGTQHGCGATSGGRVLCWGTNTEAQELGLPAPGTLRGAVPIELSGVRRVAAGERVTCALLDDGAVSCWGAGGYGQRGDGERTAASAPSLVSGLSDAVAIGMGIAHGCAVRASNDVVCWGLNDAGALGDGISHDDCGGVDCAAEPVTVVGLPPGVAVVEVDGGGLVSGGVPFIPSFTCARLADGSVWCWGSNALGTLGDGTLTDSPVPVRVRGLDDAVSLSVRGGHACVRRASGVVSCWGIGTQLATARTFPSCGLGLTCSTEPVAARTGGFVSRMVTTLLGGCVEGLDGAVRCWGRATPDSTLSRYPSSEVPGVRAPTFLSGGDNLGCAGTADGDVICWGPNRRGAFIDDGALTAPSVVLAL